MTEFDYTEFAISTFAAQDRKEGDVVVNPSSDNGRSFLVVEEQVTTDGNE